MKKTIITTLATILAASPVYAATTQASHSGILTWAFLGLCGLIVTSQLVPAVLLLVGIGKGLKSGKEIPEN
ncbi:MAG: hypothetical protein RBR06_09705 [Desulfuromonadaceae bacterium]|nr:hypothetical protein [Desulfuromonadaceae bacterium]MDY0213267.1 hypothetical protein [Desulfuromonadaceae bacterium]